MTSSCSPSRLLVLCFVLAFAAELSAQTVTMQGKSSSITVPRTTGPFAISSQQSVHNTRAVQQPSLEESEQTIPAVAPLQSAQTEALTAPGSVLGSVFDVIQGSLPPDAAIAAGPNHLLYAMNSEFNIYNKTGGLVSQSSLGQFFAGLPAADSCCFDPRATYDATHGRFIVIGTGNHQGVDAHIYIGVSQTSDPTGAWFKYALDTFVKTPEGGPTFTDFPTMGVSSSYLLLGGNQIGTSGGTETNWVWVIQLAGLLTGNTTLNVTSFADVKLPDGRRAFTIQPAIMYGTPGSAFLASTDSNPQVGGSAVHVFTIPDTGTPVLSMTDVPVTPYKVIAGAPQPNTTTQLTVGGDILISPPVWRNGSLWVTHTVADSTGTIPVVRWYEIATSTNTVKQSGTATGAGAAYLPAITVGNSGAADVVFNTSSSSQFPSAAFAHREPGDPLGQMTTVAIYQSGTGSFTSAGGRWGDYTAISADPDGVSSWTLAQYALSGTTPFRDSTAHLLSGSSPPPPTGCTASAVGVNICSPAAGTVSSPFTLSAAGLGNARITGMKAYANGVTIASSTSSTLNAQVSLAAATYNLVVKAWDSTGAVYQKSESITVGGPPPTTCSISTVGVKICSPTSGSTVSSPVQVTAAAKGTNKITGMKAYANGVTVASSTSGTLSAKVSLAPGTYTLTVKGWESTGTVHQTSEKFTVH